VFTPYGFVSNHYENKDGWGLRGMEMQEHKSGWIPEDFVTIDCNRGGGWKFYICDDFFEKTDYRNKTAGCIWAIKNKNIVPVSKEDVKIPVFVRNNKKRFLRTKLLNKVIPMPVLREKVIKLYCWLIKHFEG
jgi:hypothetical protein